MIHLAAFERWGARRTRTALFFLTSLALLGFVPALNVEDGGGWLLTAFFVFVPTIYAADFAGAWLLAGDLLEGADEETKGWAYSRIGAASMLGGVAGGLLARGMSAFFPPIALMVAGSLTLVLTGCIVAMAHRRFRPEEMPVSGSVADTDRDGRSGKPGSGRNGSLPALVLRQGGLLRQPYVQAMLGISGLAAVSALYIDFQFYAAATLTGSNSAEFFANFYIILNSASLALQVLVAPRLQARFGVGGALMLLPTLLLGSAGVFSFGGTIQSRAILKVTEGGLKASIRRSMWEQAFLPIGREARRPGRLASPSVSGGELRPQQGASHAQHAVGVLLHVH